MTVDELYADLCEAKELAETEQPHGEGSAAVELASGVPWIVTLVATWLARQLRDIGCQYKADIRAAVVKFVENHVPNAIATKMIMVAMDTAISAACDVEETL